MPPITLLTTALAVLSPILSFPIEPRRWGNAIESGILTAEWTPGFIGERPITGPNGDYLRTTFCYCKTAMSDIIPRSNFPPGKGTPDGIGIEPGEMLQGHFWRYEYYNFHDNATYFLNHYCMEDSFPLDKRGCGYDGLGGFQTETDLNWPNTFVDNDYSFIYSPLPNHAKHTWMILKPQEDVDWIYYGRGGRIDMQKRRLGKDQGLIKMPQDYVDDKCSAYCDSQLVLPYDRTVHSHGELYADLDDMCDRCK